MDNALQQRSFCGENNEKVLDKTKISGIMVEV